MKNAASDVADYLVMALEDLSDKDMTREDLEIALRRAHASAKVAEAWTGIQRLAYDVAKAASDTKMVPAAFARDIVSVEQIRPALPQIPAKAN